jgi:hypothetical protein
MNKGAGCGEYLFVTLHLEDGQTLLFVLDTGTDINVLDESLDSQLGRSIWEWKPANGVGIGPAKLRRAPKLLLGETELQTGGWIWTTDLKQMSNVVHRPSKTGRPVMGILGMPCLKHYCLQLDFDAGMLRFLDSQSASKQNWGTAFPLRKRFGGLFAIDDNLSGQKGPGSVVDTGCNGDGFLTVDSFRRWTNGMKPGVATQGVFGGSTYPDIYLVQDDRFHFNDIGLTFLDRHLVTLDFPNQRMYLKRTSNGRWMSREVESAIQFLIAFKRTGRLPGWAKDEKGQILPEEPADGLFTMIKQGDPMLYHYTVVQDTSNGIWRLQNAWRTEADGRHTNNLPLPSQP